MGCTFPSIQGFAINVWSKVIYGLVGHVREHVGIQHAKSTHGSGVVKYYNIAYETLGARLGGVNDNEAVRQVHTLCNVVECLEKLAQSPYYRTVMHLARTISVVAGVTKAVLHLHNIDAQSLILKQSTSCPSKTVMHLAPCRARPFTLFENIFNRNISRRQAARPIQSCHHCHAFQIYSYQFDDQSSWLQQSRCNSTVVTPHHRLFPLGYHNLTLNFVEFISYFFFYSVSFSCRWRKETTYEHSC